MPHRDIYDNLSPLDYRYWDKEAAQYLSEKAFTKYKLNVEATLIRVLHVLRVCPLQAVEEVEAACALITTDEVYEEEKNIGHDIRALVNCIQRRVSDQTKPFVHMTATSYDIIDSANALRYKEALENVVIPQLLKLESELITITLREAETVQIGRTHGQHAVPITFGFTIAQYVSRLGTCIETLRTLGDKLPGKFAGAVGAYNASSLFFPDPVEFEIQILNNMDVEPAEIATQIVPPEALTRLMSELIIVAGILANLADDMRHLQRSEIGEVGEEFTGRQVGSSTMPQKQNPINFENVKSLWKKIMPQVITVYMDQISEHQRDLTNSASARSYPEIVAYVVSMTKRMTKTMQKLRVNQARLERNLAASQGLIAAEPLYILLAALGHPNAHETVKQLTLKAQLEEKTLWQIAEESTDLQTYLAQMTEKQITMLTNPATYTGIAASKARTVALRWQRQLHL